MHDDADHRLYEHEVLSREDQHALLVKYRKYADRYGPNLKRTLAVRNTIIEHNMKLVYTVARRFRAPPGWDEADLRAYGVEGVVKAIERFEPARGLAFSTYATWWIRHGIDRAISDYGSTVRAPVHSRSAAAKPEAAERAAATRRIGSLNARVSADDERTVGDMLSDDSEGVHAELVDAETVARVRAAIDELPELQRKVIRARMADRTQRDIGSEMRISREQVAGIEWEAQAALRKLLGPGEHAA